MTIDASLISRLRRMVAEPANTTYSDADLSVIIADYPLNDSNHVEPGKSGWIPTYDLHAAAQDIWEEKAANLQLIHDFSADGQSYTQSQQYTQAMDQARLHGARRKAQARKMVKMPRETIYGRIRHRRFFGNFTEGGGTGVEPLENFQDV